MKKALTSVGVTAILILTFIFMLGMAYYVGKPVYDGIKLYGWLAVIWAIAAGVLVGLIMWVAYNVPWLIYKLIHKNK